jgi:uncharacterized protein YbjT (DUF2867 family)
MSLSILLTGATGKVGRHVIDALQPHSDAHVVAAVRDPSRAAHLGVPAVRFDYDDPTTWRPALTGVRSLYLVTPPFHPREVELGKQLIGVARDAGVKRIVKLSALGAEHLDAFAHKTVDAFLADSGLQFTLLRPTFFSQNFGVQHAASIKATGAFHLAAGDGKTAFIDTRDIAAVAARALLQPGHGGKTYELTGARALDHHEVAAILSEAAGREIRYVPVSEQQAIDGMRLAGLPEAGVQALTALMGLVRAGHTARTTPTVHEVLGHAPISFEQYAADDADAFRS